MEKHEGYVRYTDNKGKGEVELGKQKYDQHDHGFSHQYTARDLIRETLKDLYERVIQNIEYGKKHFDGDFYIEVERVADKVLPDHERRHFISREDCPKPFYDQIVYKYNRSRNTVSILWNIPDLEYAEELRYKITDFKDGEKELKENVMKYYNRDLAILSYNENKKPDKKIII